MEVFGFRFVFGALRCLVPMCCLLFSSHILAKRTRTLSIFLSHLCGAHDEQIDILLLVWSICRFSSFWSMEWKRYDHFVFVVAAFFLFVTCGCSVGASCTIATDESSARSIVFKHHFYLLRMLVGIEVFDVSTCGTKMSSFKTLLRFDDFFVCAQKPFCNQRWRMAELWMWRDSITQRRKERCDISKHRISHTHTTLGNRIDRNIEDRTEQNCIYYFY